MILSVGVVGIRLRPLALAVAALLALMAGIGAGPLRAQDAEQPEATPAPQAAAPLSSFSSGMLAGGGTIQHIRVVGTQRIEPETVLSYLAVGPGDVFDPETVDLSLKRLFATGLFADVVMRREANDLIVQVVENPIINRVVFEGNHSKDDKKLGDEVQVRPRTVFTRARVQADVHASSSSIGAPASLRQR